MKYLIISVLAIVLSACGGSNEVEVGNKTTMEVLPEVFDAGDVVKGEMINAKFTLKNTGDYPLVLGEVKGTCSCTVADYPEEPIPPGGTGEILAHVNTNETGVGPLNKSVNIVANTEASITTVSVRADVMRK